MSVGTLLRLLAIAVGIMSVALLARDGLKIALHEYLDAILIVYDDTLKTLALVFFEPIMTAVLVLLRRLFGITLTLHSHWKHAFILLWLVFGTWVRTLPTNISWIGWGWAGFCALAGACLVGLHPIWDLRNLYWPIGIIVFYGFSASLDLSDSRSRAAFGFGCAFTGGFAYLLTIWLGKSSAEIAGPLAAVMILVVGIVLLFLDRRLANTFVASIVVTGSTVMFAATALEDYSPPEEYRQMEAITLAPTVAFVALLGVIALLVGAMRRDASYTSLGVNILSVLGGAAFIVWLGHALA